MHIYIYIHIYMYTYLNHRVPGLSLASGSRKCLYKLRCSEICMLTWRTWYVPIEPVPMFCRGSLCDRCRGSLCEYYKGEVSSFQA